VVADRSDVVAIDCTDAVGDDDLEIDHRLVATIYDRSTGKLVEVAR
jgi:hypothetical protein